MVPLLPLPFLPAVAPIHLRCSSHSSRSTRLSRLARHRLAATRTTQCHPGRCRRAALPIQPARAPKHPGNPRRRPVKFALHPVKAGPGEQIVLLDVPLHPVFDARAFIIDTVPITRVCESKDAVGRTHRRRRFPRTRACYLAHGFLPLFFVAAVCAAVSSFPIVALHVAVQLAHHIIVHEAR